MFQGGKFQLVIGIDISERVGTLHLEDKIMQLLITIDTECDNSWKRSHDVTTDNAKFLVRFQDLCESFGYKPTYLTAYEMAIDEFFVEFARDVLKREVGEIGAHPHAWNSPPEYKLTSDDMKYHPYLIEYPKSVIESKIDFLTKLLEDTFSTRMYSHRAGRWAFNKNYAKILMNFGYKLDCSITPHIKWMPGKRPAGEPAQPIIDYTAYTDSYFFIYEDTIKKNKKLLEVPMTIVRSYGTVLQIAYSALPEGLFRKCFRYIWGRPYSWFRPHPIYSDLKTVALQKLKMPSDYIMFMLHSSEFMPGGSPNFKSKRSIDKLFNQIEEVFDFLKTHNISGMTCKEFLQHIELIKQSCPSRCAA